MAGAHTLTGRPRVRLSARARLGVRQRSLSLFVLVGVLLLEVGGDGLHDLVGLVLVIDGVRVQVLRRAQLQLGHSSLLILLDCDLIGLGQVCLFPPHHLDEFFQIFDFLGLLNSKHAR